MNFFRYVLASEIIVSTSLICDTKEIQVSIFNRFPPFLSTVYIISYYRQYVNAFCNFLNFFESSAVLVEDFFVVQKKTALAKPSKHNHSREHHLHGLYSVRGKKCLLLRKCFVGRCKRCSRSGYQCRYCSREIVT